MVDSILRPLGAIIGGVLDAWGWTARRAERHTLLLAIIPRVLGDQALTVPQLARRAEADTLWPYGAISHAALTRALDDLVAAGRVIGPLGSDDAEERYALPATVQLVREDDAEASAG